MFTITKASKWVLSVMMFTALVFISSCGGDDKEDPVIPPADFTYTPTTVGIGEEGTVSPSAVAGDSPTFAITDFGEADDFISIDASTGVISVVKESSLGIYNVVVSASNSAGSASGTAEITIGLSEAFNPVGKTFEWQYFMNQSEDLTLTGLDGLPGMDFPEMTLPVGWPTASTTEEQMPAYLLFTGVAGMLFQAPGDEVCVTGNSLQFKVNEDLTLSAICSEGDPAVIGFAFVSFADDKFVFEPNLYFTETIALPYAIDGATFADFVDPLTQESYSSLQGRVNAFTIPTDLTDEDTMQDITTWTTPVVDVVLRVVE